MPLKVLPSSLRCDRPALDDRAVDGTGADRDVGAGVDRRRQLAQLLQRRREIDVGEQHVVGLRLGDPGGDRGALAPVPREVQHRLQSWRHGLGLAQQLAGAVVAAIVDDQHLGSSMPPAATAAWAVVESTSSRSGSLARSL